MSAGTRPGRTASYSWRVATTAPECEMCASERKLPMVSLMSAALTARMTSDARPASKKGTASPVARTLAGAGPIPDHPAEERRRNGGEHRERRRNGDGDEGVRGLAGGRSTGCMNTHAQTRNPYLRRQRLRAVQLQQARRWRRRESSGPSCASYDLRKPTSLSVFQLTVCHATLSKPAFRAPQFRQRPESASFGEVN